MTMNESRYQDKPLLRIIECYVLWAIDSLPAKDANILKEITPKLQTVYGVQGTWQEIVAAVMEFPPKMPDIIRGLWKKNTEIAARNKEELTPQQFAEIFFDQNFAG